MKRNSNLNSTCEHSYSVPSSPVQFVSAQENTDTQSAEIQEQRAPYSVAARTEMVRQQLPNLNRGTTHHRCH